MTHYELYFSVPIVAFQVALCVLVYSRHLQKRLPFFAAYATTLLVSSVVLSFTFARFGFRTAASYYASWIAAAVIVLARSSAIAELCRYTLRAYQGIWALTWRFLALMILFFFVHAALDARGQPNWIATYTLTVERDVAISSVAILVAILAIGYYYRIPVEPLLKWIGVGICFFCIIGFLNSTMLRDALARYMVSWTAMGSRIDHVNEVWNTIQTFATIVCIGVWCYALRKPLPAASKEPELLPAEVYRTLSPQLNLRLRAFNDRLLDMLES